MSNFGHKGRTRAIGKFDWRKRKKFIKVLKRRGNMGEACIAVGISRTSVHRQKRKNGSFKRQFEDAVEHAIDKMEKEAHRRAVKGVIKKKFFQGRVCGLEREFSDGLLEFLLRGNREKFKSQTHKLIGDITRPLVTANMDEATAERMYYDSLELTE